jgi:hypothetical protein
MYVMYYVSTLRCWQLIMILVKTNHPCLRVGHHTRHARLCSGALLGDTQPSALNARGGAHCLDTCIIDFYIKCMAFYQGMLTSRWNYYSAYACIPGRVTIIDSDGTGPHTRVYPIRHISAPVAMPYLHQVMNASFSQGGSVGRAYPIRGSPRVRCLDARVPPRLR